MLLNVIKNKKYCHKVLVLVSAVLFAKELLLVLTIVFTGIVNIPAEVTDSLTSVTCALFYLIYCSSLITLQLMLLTLMSVLPFEINS